jgi:hypothetical protein
VILYTREDVAKRVRELTNGVGASVVYDSVGKDTFAGSIDSLKREMRWADTSTMVVTTLNGSTRLSFRTPIGYDAGAVVWSPAITYQINPSNVDSNHDGVLNEGCLVRIQSGRTTVLCNDVPLGGFVAELTGSTLQFSLRVAATGLDRRVAASTVSAAVTLRIKSSGGPP